MTKREPDRYHNKAIFNRSLPSYKKPSHLKCGQVYNLSCEKEFYLHENEKSLPYQRLST